jgi:hypothetical protein
MTVWFTLPDWRRVHQDAGFECFKHDRRFSVAFAFTVAPPSLPSPLSIQHRLHSLSSEQIKPPRIDIEFANVNPGIGGLDCSDVTKEQFNPRLLLLFSDLLGFF